MELTVASKPDSQNICFVPEGHYTDVIKKIRPHAAQPGDIVDQVGTVLGHHRGVIYYTVGQRRGLGLGEHTGTDPLFVIHIDADAKQVVVGPRSALQRSDIYLSEVNWIGPGTLADADGLAIKVKVRSTHPPERAALHVNGDEVLVHLAEPDIGISPGQACVFYEDRADAQRTLGGGWITRTA